LVNALVFNGKAVVERRGFRPKIFDDGICYHPQRTGYCSPQIALTVLSFHCLPITAKKLTTSPTLNNRVDNCCTAERSCSKVKGMVLIDFALSFLSEIIATNTQPTISGDRKMMRSHST